MPTPDRLERLLNLLATLIDAERPLSREELLGTIPGYGRSKEGARRSFERDKDLLRALGVPLVTEPLDPMRADQVGYRVPRELYELPDPGLDEAELAALRLAAAAVHLEGEWTSAAVTQALRKLGGAVSAGTGPKTAIEARLATYPVSLEVASRVFEGLLQRQRLSFTYGDLTRQVDPWRLSVKRGRWYLTAFDHLRVAPRSFRLDRIRPPVELLEPPGAFEPPASLPGGPLPAWVVGEAPPVVVEVRFDPEHARRALAELGPSAQATTSPDGDVVVRVEVSDLGAFRSFVLGYLEHAEVLSPPAFRQMVIAWLEDIAGPEGAEPLASPRRGG